MISVRATKFNRRRITPTRNQVFLHPHSSLTSRDPRMQRVLGFPDLLYNSATTIMQLKRNWHICIKISVYHLLIYKYRFGIRFILRTCARFLKKRSFATHVAWIRSFIKPRHHERKWSINVKRRRYWSCAWQLDANMNKLSYLDEEAKSSIHYQKPGSYSR